MAEDGDGSINHFLRNSFCDRSSVIPLIIPETSESDSQDLTQSISQLSLLDENNLPESTSAFPQKKTCQTVRQLKRALQESSFESTHCNVSRESLSRDELSISNTPDLDISQPQPKRRRIADPALWEKFQRKAKRNRGDDYVMTTGEVRQKRSIGRPCNCPRQCHRKFLIAHRRKIFGKYWNLGDINRQSQVISNLVQRVPCKRRYTHGLSRRRHTIQYFLELNNRRAQVCKIFFLNTLDITDKRVNVVLKKKARQEMGILEEDQRGRHVPANALPPQVLQCIKEHIQSLPKVPSHWTRKDTNRVYIEGVSTKCDLYKLYKQYAQQRGIRAASSIVYTRKLIEMNISLFKPKKDRCWCYGFEEKRVEDRPKSQAEYECHISRKDAAQNEKNGDKEKAKSDATIMTVNFDLQAILFAPLLADQQIFYKRKLATFNLTVFDTAKKKGHCYLWREDQGKKGAIEVGSCLAKFINENIASHVKTLNLFSDSCPGQNKNAIILSALGYALFQHPTLKKINMKYLEPGHTYMECDSMHAVIERAARKERIYVPNDWVRVIRGAKKTGKEYVTNVLTQSDFIDFKAYRAQLVQSTLRTVNGTRLTWSNIRWIQIRKRNPTTFYVKSEFDDENWEKVNLRAAFNAVDVEGAWQQPNPISKSKYDDLMELCRTKVIPTRHHNFYRNICHDNDENYEAQNPDGRAVASGSR